MITNRATGVGVVIPAAGKGLRLGGTRKQFRELSDKPVLYWTVRVFDLHEAVEHITIAAPESDVESVYQLLEREQIKTTFKVVAGGASRQESVYRAVKSLPDRIDTVLIHDGVRPFLRSAMISAIIESIAENGAAALAIPVADTLRKGQSGLFVETIQRDGVFRMQTPQGAHRVYFENAFKEAEQMGWRVTDDVNVLQRAGYPVHIVEGSSLNIKITTRADWEMACLIWPVWNQVS